MSYYHRSLESPTHDDSVITGDGLELSLGTHELHLKNPTQASRIPSINSFNDEISVSNDKINQK